MKKILLFLMTSFSIASAMESDLFIPPTAENKTVEIKEGSLEYVKGEIDKISLQVQAVRDIPDEQLESTLYQQLSSIATFLQQSNKETRESIRKYFERKGMCLTLDILEGQIEKRDKFSACFKGYYGNLLRVMYSDPEYKNKGMQKIKDALAYKELPREVKTSWKKIVKRKGKRKKSSTSCEPQPEPLPILLSAEIMPIDDTAAASLILPIESDNEEGELPEDIQRQLEELDKMRRNGASTQQTNKNTKLKKAKGITQTSTTVAVQQPGAMEISTTIPVPYKSLKNEIQKQWQERFNKAKRGVDIADLQEIMEQAQAMPELQQKAAVYLAQLYDPLKKRSGNIHKNATIAAAFYTKAWQLGLHNYDIARPALLAARMIDDIATLQVWISRLEDQARTNPELLWIQGINYLLNDDRAQAALYLGEWCLKKDVVEQDVYKVYLEKIDAWLVRNESTLSEKPSQENNIVNDDTKLLYALGRTLWEGRKYVTLTTQPVVLLQRAAKGGHPAAFHYLGVKSLLSDRERIPFLKDAVYQKPGVLTEQEHNDVINALKMIVKKEGVQESKEEASIVRVNKVSAASLLAEAAYKKGELLPFLNKNKDVKEQLLDIRHFPGIIYFCSPQCFQLISATAAKQYGVDVFKLIHEKMRSIQQLWEQESGNSVTDLTLNRLRIENELVEITCQATVGEKRIISCSIPLYPEIPIQKACAVKVVGTLEEPSVPAILFQNQKKGKQQTDAEALFQLAQKAFDDKCYDAAANVLYTAVMQTNLLQHVEGAWNNVEEKRCAFNNLIANLKQHTQGGAAQYVSEIEAYNQKYQAALNQTAINEAKAYCKIMNDFYEEYRRLKENEKTSTEAYATFFNTVMEKVPVFKEKILALQKEIFSLPMGEFSDKAPKKLRSVLFKSLLEECLNAQRRLDNLVGLQIIEIPGINEKLAQLVALRGKIVPHAPQENEKADETIANINRMLKQTVLHDAIKSIEKVEEDLHTLGEKPSKENDE